MASSTVVGNLNSSLLQGADWGSPLAIGNVTASTGQFTYLNINGSTSGTIGIGNTTGNYNLVLPTTLGTTGQFLTLANNTGTLEWSIPIVYYISDTKTAGTTSGSFTSGAWRTRTLNTITSSSGSGTDVTLATNQMTITPGTYSVSISAPAYGCGTHACRLFNITTGLVVAFGTSGSSNTGGSSIQTVSLLNCSLILSSTNVFEIQHRCSNNSNTNGFGLQTGFQNEVFAMCQITKLI